MTEHKDLRHISWNRVFEIIGEPNQSKCWKMYRENYQVMDKARGSKTKHQAWEGGYIDHICECVGVAEKMYETLSKLRPLEFTLADAALVLFLHDLEKPWKHQVGEILGGQKINNKIVDSMQFGPQRSTPERPAEKAKVKFCLKMATDYEIELTEKIKNAIIYVEGEGIDYDPYERVQSDLAAFCHCCDTISARIWFQYPRVTS